MIDYDKTIRELLFILGVCTPIIMDYIPKTTDENIRKKWIIESIECVVYKNEPIPVYPYD